MLTINLVGQVLSFFSFSICRSRGSTHDTLAYWFYLELARAAHCTSSRLTPSSRAVLSGVFFLKPLFVDTSLWLQITVDDEAHVEVSSGKVEASGSLIEPSVHCTGLGESSSQPESIRAPAAALRAERGAVGVQPATLYDHFHAIGLHYGPAYRMIVQAWQCNARRAATSRLRRRGDWQGTSVHPADLDGALQLSSTMTGRDGGLRVPFAIDVAHMGDAAAARWTVSWRAHRVHRCTIRLTADNTTRFPRTGCGARERRPLRRCHSTSR